MAKETKNEVAVTSDRAQLPDGLNLDELIEDAKRNPKMDAGDVALPFLSILQSNSPEVNPGHSNYIQGAQASMFLNTVTNEVFDGRGEGLLIVPCYYERKLVEWVDRDKGGGWVGDYPLGHEIQRSVRKNERGKDVLPNGNFLVETAYHYVLWLNPNLSRWGQAVIGLKSTALRPNRALNNLIAESVIPGTEITAPRYLFPYVMRTVFEQKAENSWWNFDFQKVEEPVMADVYKNAKQFAQLAEAGVVSRSRDAEQGSAAAGGMTIDGQARRPLDDDIPF